jgi:hypothetical protein
MSCFKPTVSDTGVILFATILALSALYAPQPPLPPERR